MERRQDENDLVNGHEIVDNRLDVHELIKSLDDSAWAPKQGDVDEVKDSGTEKKLPLLI
jgi:hypothetical protein